MNNRFMLQNKNKNDYNWNILPKKIDGKIVNHYILESETCYLINEIDTFVHKAMVYIKKLIDPISYSFHMINVDIWHLISMRE